MSEASTYRSLPVVEQRELASCWRCVNFNKKFSHPEFGVPGCGLRNGWVWLSPEREQCKDYAPDLLTRLRRFLGYAPKMLTFVNGEREA